MARVLVIDDDKNNRFAIRRILEMAGHDVIEAVDGEQGVDQFELMIARGEPADVVISDIIMPKLSGQEVIAEIKKKNGETKVIAISGGGRGTDELFQQVSNFVAADYVLKKPFTPVELLKVLGECLA